MFYLDLNKDERNEYLGSVFLRRDGPYAYKAVRVLSFTQAGYARCEELPILVVERRDNDPTPGQYLGIDFLANPTSYLGKRIKLCLSLLNSKIQLREGTFLAWNLVTDPQKTYWAHQDGWRPGCVSNF